MKNSMVMVVRRARKKEKTRMNPAAELAGSAENPEEGAWAVARAWD